MPAIVYRIDQLFPDLREDVMDENVLLQTIRVPKKLLSLTNRLPKPNYSHEVIENETHSDKSKEVVAEANKLQEVSFSSSPCKVIKDPRIQEKEQRVQPELRQNLQQKVSMPSKILYNNRITFIAHQVIPFLKKPKQDNQSEAETINTLQ
jgi:hypothetical protein